MDFVLEETRSKIELAQTTSYILLLVRKCWPHVDWRWSFSSLERGSPRTRENESAARRRRSMFVEVTEVSNFSPCGMTGPYRYTTRNSSNQFIRAVSSLITWAVSLSSSVFSKYSIVKSLSSSITWYLFFSFSLCSFVKWPRGHTPETAHIPSRWRNSSPLTSMRSSGYFVSFGSHSGPQEVTAAT